jgi:hypothetical protein
MKPIVIIVIAVVCSVGAMIGVLGIIQGLDSLQYQQKQNEYEHELVRQEEIEKQVVALETPLNREICIDLFANQMAMAGESNPYAVCLEKGSRYAVDQAISECNQIREFELLASQCELTNMVNYYNSLIPKLEKLTWQERELMGFDSETMNMIRGEWDITALTLKAVEVSIDDILYGDK